MNALLVLHAIIAVTAADVSHLANRYLPPNQQEQRSRRLPSNERVETTLEKHEVIELPTQIEIIKDGQPIYGVPSISKMEFARMSPKAEMAEMQPLQEIKNLQPPPSYGITYEMPMRSYLPPVLPEITTTEISITTTEIPTTTNEMRITSTTSMVEEESTTGQSSTLPITTEHIVEATTIPTLRNHYLPPVLPNDYNLPPTSTLANQYIPPIMLQNQYLAPTTPPAFAENRSLQSAEDNKQNPLPVIPEEMSEQFQMPETRYLPAAMPNNQYLAPVMPVGRSLPSRMSANQYPASMTKDHILSSPMPEIQYLPPVGMMLPPPLPMPQPTYQQYQEQLMRDQQQMNRDRADVISQMEEQYATTKEPQRSQMQPIAPVEPAHSFSNEGYHYKTGEEDLNRFRYRR